MSVTIDLDLMRKHCGIDETVDDDLLRAYIDTAIQIAETYTGLHFRRVKFKGQVEVTDYGMFFTKDKDVSDLKVTDDLGNVFEYHKNGPRKYLLKATCDVFRYSGYYPTVVNVEYHIGPSPDEPLDPVIQQAIRQLVAYSYDNRGSEANTSGQVGVNAIVSSSGASQMLNLYKGIGF